MARRRSLAAVIAISTRSSPSATFQLPPGLSCGGLIARQASLQSEEPRGMNSSQRPDVEPGDYLGVLRRRWWIVIGLVILGAAGAVGYLKVAHKEYTATASVYVQATGVQAISVATIAAHTLHASSPTALSSHVSVTVPANSQVLQISCTQHTAADAAACAQAFANAYLKNRSATATGQLNATLATLRSQVAPLQRDVAKLTAKIAALPSNSPQEATAKAQLNSDQSQLSALNR